MPLSIFDDLNPDTKAVLQELAAIGRASHSRFWRLLAIWVALATTLGAVFQTLVYFK